MPARRIRVAPADALREGFEEIRDAGRRRERLRAGGPRRGAGGGRASRRRRRRRRPRVELPFVTIDPPGSRDLDQALHIERRGEGHRVSYAIADVGSFVVAGGPLDGAAHARGVTVYSPDFKAPLLPPVLSEGAASLLPGQWSPAVLWTLDLDDPASWWRPRSSAPCVRSAAQHTYADVPPSSSRCCARSASGDWRSSDGAAGCASTCPSRRSPARAARGPSATAHPCRARTRTPRCRCSRAWRQPS